MTAMRVGFVSQAAYGLFDPSCTAPFGGAELQMYLLAVELGKRPDLDVHFLVQDYGQAKRQRFGDVTVWRYSRPLKHSKIGAPIRWLASALSMYSTLGAIAPDVCIESPAGFPTTVAATWRRRHARARFVYRMASDADVDGGISPFALERRAALRAILKADAVIAQNLGQQRFLADRFGILAPIVRNGFPMPSVSPGDKDGSVLWVSSSQQLKQPGVFLDLAEVMPDVRFVMVMPRSNAEVFEQMRSRAMGLANVDFLPGVAWPEIQRFFDKAAAFVNTSTVEGFPNTFIQAAMGATPVLSLNVDPDGVLSSRGFGVCLHGDEARLSSTLRNLLADDEARSRMGRAGFEYAMTTHDVEAISEQVAALLRTVAGEA